MQIFTTKNSKETQELGKTFAQKMKGGGILCLEGNLGSGKTTFAQGFLKELKVKGPYTSPTFLIMKQYKLATHNSHHITKNKNNSLRVTSYELRDVYHIDTYRVRARDMLNLGWEEIIANKNTVVIVEWADRIKKIIPKKSVWLKFEWVAENERLIIMQN